MNEILQLIIQRKTVKRRSVGREEYPGLGTRIVQRQVLQPIQSRSFQSKMIVNLRHEDGT